MRISDRSSDVCSSSRAPGTLRNLAISASNPTNPTGQNIVLIQRRLAEPGHRQFFQETDTWQGTFGLRGKLSIDWAWEVAVSFGRNTAVDGPTKIANLVRDRNSRDSNNTRIPAGLSITCSDYLAFGRPNPQ